MTAAELAKADQLLNEVDAKLNDSDYVFCDGTGEAYISQLRSLAKQFAADNRSVAARNFEHVASRVAERSE